MRHVYERLSGALRRPTADRRPSPKDSAERRVRERFPAGDPEAVRALYRTYGPLVYGVAFRVLGDVGLSEEATQLTFLRAWQAAADFDVSREFGPWRRSPGA